MPLNDFQGGMTMTTMRKWMAMLTAICCMGSTAAMTANAETEIGAQDQYISYEKTSEDGVYYHFGDRKSSYIVVTDGTAPAEEDLVTELFGKEMKLYTGAGEFQLGPFYDPVHGWMINGRIDTITPELQAQLDAYGENAKLYCVGIDNDFSNDALMLTRKFMIENDYVLDIIQLTGDSYGAACWNGNFYCKFKEDMTAEALSARWKEIKADSPLADAIAFYENHRMLELTLEMMIKYSYTPMTEEDIAQFRADNHMLSEYDMTVMAYEAAAQTVAENPDVEIISPNLAHANSNVLDDETLEYYKSSNLWDGCGDFDANTEVNAADAADILQYASESGSKVYPDLLTDAQYDAGDVNCDGTVNAMDAAKILEYAAAVGTQGEAVNWADILR